MYRLTIGGISIIIASGWTNSAMIYIYLPILQLIFNKPCTIEFLQLAKKFLILGMLQPTFMGLLMLLIIMHFARDEKRRCDIQNSADE
jgi:hypothetical protein